MSTTELVVRGRECEAAKVVRLWADLGIDRRLVRGREGEPAAEVNESCCLQVILMMNRVVAVCARNKLRT